MRSSLSHDKILDIFLPPGMWDEDADDDEYEQNKVVLTAHLKTIPALAAQMEKEIRKRDKDGLPAFYDNLLRVAGSLMNTDDSEIAGAAVKLAATVVSKGGNAEWAGRIFDDYDKFIDLAIGNMSQIVESREELEDADMLDELTTDMDQIIGDVFAAASLIATSPVAEKFHARAEKCLNEAAKQDLQEYTRLLIKIAPLCTAPDEYPGAVTVIGNSYDTMVLYKGKAYEEQKKAGKIQAAKKTTWDLMFIDAGMIVQFHGTPALGERAGNALCAHWMSFYQVSPDGANKALDKLARAYAKHPCGEESFKQGQKKLLAFIEDLKIVGPAACDEQKLPRPEPRVKDKKPVYSPK